MLITNIAKPYHLGNALIVGPNDNLAAKYNWLKSSDRDGKMGALSATNRRTLILAPGTYTLTSTWTLDTDYVDIASLSDNPKDTIVTRATGGSAVEQTADDIDLVGFTIQTTGTSDGQTPGGDIGFEIDASDNTNSLYQNMHFKGTAVDIRYGLPVFGTSDLGGTWINCHATGWAWRVATNKELKAVMYDCISWKQTIGEYDSNYGYGKNSFGGDADGADCSGRFHRCIGGQGSWGGCTTYGCKCSGYFYECVGGDFSFALAREFSGIAIRCKAGKSSFAGGGCYGGECANFSGVAIDCIAEGSGSDSGWCFAMGSAESSQSGTMIGCRVGREVDYASGVSGALATGTPSSWVAASLTTDMSGGDNSNIILTAVDKGRLGNEISFTIVPQVPALWTCIVTGKKITINKGTGLTKTATELQAKLESNSDAMALVSVAQVGDGTGNIDESLTPPVNLSGGTQPPTFKDNHPWLPSVCKEDTTVYPFDNGHTYTNAGASAAVEFTLPDAVLGLKYTFIRTEAGAGKDVKITPQSGDAIVQLDGTDLGNGDAYENTADAYGEVTLECRIANKWQVTREIGTWAEA